jgi:hypothetical protein
MYLELDYYINTSSNKNKLLSILSGEWFYAKGNCQSKR